MKNRKWRFFLVATLLLLCMGTVSATFNGQILRYDMESGSCPIEDVSSNGADNDGTCQGGSITSNNPVWGSYSSEQTSLNPYGSDVQFNTPTIDWSGDITIITTQEIDSYEDYARLWTFQGGLGGKWNLYSSGSPAFECHWRGTKVQGSNGVDASTLGKFSTILRYDDSSQTVQCAYYDHSTNSYNVMGNKSVSGSAVTDKLDYGGAGGQSEGFDGRGDELRVFKRLLTQSQAKKIAKNNLQSFNDAPSYSSVSTSPSIWTIGSSINVSANVSDDATVSSVSADVFENGSKIVNDASLSDSDGDGVWEVSNLFTVDESDVYYNFSLTATDNDGATSTYSDTQFIEDSNPVFNISKPENKTYRTQNLEWKLVNTSDSDDVQGESLSITIKEDGSQVGTDTVTEGTDSTGSWTSKDGSHTFSAKISEADGDTTKKTLSYEVDTSPPNVSIISPANGSKTNTTSSIDLNYIVDDPNLDSSSCKYSKDGGTNFSISNCSNTSIQYGSVGTHNLTLYGSDTLNNTGSDSNSFFVDLLNKVRAEDQTTGASIKDFEVTISNSSETIGGTTTDGRFEFYTSNMPKGSVNVSVEADGYKIKTKQFSSVDNSFNQDIVFSLERAGLELSVFNEQNNNKISKPVKIELRNSSTSKEVVWGESYIPNSFSTSGTLDSGDPPAAFDEDKSTGWKIGGQGGGTTEIQGYVSLKEGINNIKLKGRAHSDGCCSSQLEKVEMYKNGAWKEVLYVNQGYTDAKFSKSFTINNSNNAFTGRIKVIFDDTAEASDSNVLDAGLKEVWSENLGAPSFEYPNYPTGDVKITADDNANDEYRSRNYIVSLDENAKVSLKAFLLKRGEGILTTIETRGPQNDPLTGSSLSIQRFIDSVYRTVAQGRTKSDGSASFYLDPDTSYRVVATNPGYDSFTGSFSPANYQYNPLLIRLGKSNNFTESTEWSTVEYKLLPDQDTLNASGVYRFNWSVIDSENSLSEFGLRIRNASGALLASDSVSGSPSGGSTVIKFNLSNSSVGGKLEVTGYFVKDQTEFNFKRNYDLIETVSPGIFSIKSIMKGFESGSSSTTQSFLALIVTLMVGTGLKSKFNRAGGGMLTLLVLGFFTLQGWFSGFFWILTALTLVGLYGRRG